MIRPPTTPSKKLRGESTVRTDEPQYLALAILSLQKSQVLEGRCYVSLPLPPCAELARRHAHRKRRLLGLCEKPRPVKVGRTLPASSPLRALEITFELGSTLRAT
jgi:hypothetical protein